MNLLIVSNGFGEDIIACNLIQAIKKHEPNAIISCLPLVGAGLEYESIELTPLIKNPTLPSGGFIRNIKVALTDLTHGLFSQILKQRKLMKALSPTVDITICVGDVYCLVMGSYSNPSKCYFLPTAKSNRFMKHSHLELWLIKHYAKRVYPRDAETAAALQCQGIPAYYFGNPMFDNLCDTADQTQLSSKPSAPLIGLLPGSRQEAYDNLIVILNAIEFLSQEQSTGPLNFVLAKSKNIDLNSLSKKLSATAWQLANADNKALITHKKNGLQIHITEHFKAVIQQAWLIIGLAGTANEQAVFLGKTVICFPGTGPQSTPTRFKEQQKLLGEKLIFINSKNPETIAASVAAHIPKQCPTIKPQPNASKKICEDIVASTHI